MKHILQLFIITCLLYSCTNEEIKTAQTDTTTGLSYNADSIKKAILPFINGTWIADEYCQAIEQTKSPYIANSKVEYFNGFVFNDDTWSDSLYGDYNLGNHEGGTFAVYYRPAHTTNALPTNLTYHDFKTKRRSSFGEIGYEITGKDTFLLAYFYDNANALVKKSKYRKIVPGIPGNEFGFGIEHVMNKLLTGRYTYTDSTGKINWVKFTRDGSVDGLNGYSGYEILADYTTEETEGDKISLIYPNEKTEWHFFKIEGNKLNIYEIIKQDKGGPGQKGPLKYQLIKEEE
jgi:hypothetical protein